MLLLLRLLNKQNRLMDEKKDGEGGGGGAPDSAKDIADLKAQIAELTKLIAKPKDDPKPDDKDLGKKAEDLKAQKDKELAGGKAMESAIKFNLKSGEFFKAHESLLPKDFKDLLDASEKENYASEVEKSNALKDGFIKKFFAQQANRDLLTQGQKTVLDDFEKLTNNARQEKASEIYDMIFEPTIERLKGMKKAEALSKGFGSNDDSKTAYKNKLITLGKKHYLGEKTNA